RGLNGTGRLVGRLLKRRCRGEEEREGEHRMSVGLGVQVRGSSEYHQTHGPSTPSASRWRSPVGFGSSNNEASSIVHERRRGPCEYFSPERPDRSDVHSPRCSANAATPSSDKFAAGAASVCSESWAPSR